MAKCKEHPLNVPLIEQKLPGGLRVRGILISLSGGATIIACCATAYLIFQHARNYTKPKEQRQIIRILLMVPIYSIACTLSIPFYKQNVYIGSIYEFYEAVAIVSFFLLLCQFLHSDPATLRRVFNLLEPKPWLHPIRFLVKHVGRNKKGQTVDGLKWFNIIWFCVFQFCVVKFLGAVTKCITEALDVYCEESKDANHARIWVMVIEIVSLATAMMCLLQFYHQTKQEIDKHRPLLKFLALKLVVFLFYMQSFIFDFLTKKDGPIKPSSTISYPSWAVGIPNTLLCFEMAGMSILHFWAYPYDVYRDRLPNKTSEEEMMRDTGQHPIARVLATRSGHSGLQHVGSTLDDRVSDDTGPTPSADSDGHAARFRWQALADALNFADIVLAVARAFHWLILEHRIAPETGGSRDTHHNMAEGTERTRASDWSRALDLTREQTT